jgi:hypothetical protein
VTCHQHPQAHQAEQLPIPPDTQPNVSQPRQSLSLDINTSTTGMP